MSLFRGFGLVACLALFTSSAMAQVMPLGTKVHKDLAYVPDGHSRQKLDLYVPSGSADRPLVIWIHGGGWESGSKEGPGAAGLVWKGYAVASINYRLSSDAPFPAQYDDCRAAVCWLKSQAETYGYRRDRVGICGASAGGHLSSLVAVRANDGEQTGEADSRVHAVCNFCGPSDLMLYGKSKPGDTLSKLMGGPIQDRQDLVELANPIKFVDRDDPPFFIVHGDKDTIVPVAHSQQLDESLRKAGVPSSLQVLSGWGHDVVRHGESLKAAAEFFDHHLLKQ